MKIKERSDYGYDSFKKDISIKDGDIKNILSTDHLTELNHNWSFIRMNDDYIELIDQFYAKLGKGLMPLILTLPIVIMLYIVMFYSLFIGFYYFETGIYYFFIFNFIIVSTLLLLFLLRPFLKYEKGKSIYHPIIFNRINQKVYFYINKQEYIEKHWLDVTYSIVVDEGFLGYPVCEFRAHIIEDGILKDTFLIGFPKINGQGSWGLWSFICHYMQEGPEDLYLKPHPMYGTIDPFKQLTFCHKILGSKESIKDTWNSFRCIYYRNPISAVFAFPFDICTLVGRRFLLKFKPLPVWPEQVAKENDFQKIRPEEINCKDNFEFTILKMKDK